MRPRPGALDLEADVNRWLAANPKLITIQRDAHVYHEPATGKDDR